MRNEMGDKIKYLTQLTKWKKPPLGNENEHLIKCVLAMNNDVSENMKCYC